MAINWDLDVPTELDQARTLITDALEALTDEHEGNMRAAIVEAHDKLGAVRELIENW